MPSTYSESARGVRVTYERAMLELKRHCVTDAPSIAEFRSNCWDRYQRNGLIDAKHIFHFLGY